MKNIISKIILFFCAALLIYYIGDIFSYLGDLFSDMLLGSKFKQLAGYINEGNTEELGSRPILIKRAFGVWLTNPIFGTDISNLNAHSLIMSTLAGTGLVGFALLAYIFIVSTKLIYAEVKKYKKGKSLFVCSTIFVVALAFFNPIGYVFEMTIATYFIVPVCIKYFCEKDYE